MTGRLAEQIAEHRGARARFPKRYRVTRLVHLERFADVARSN
ncbi:MAG: hypothetical protein R3D89_11585 [Sphingomonadaceae bacterium]